ncbi:MAG: tetratricopeptide repeat protein [Stenotrophomonas koreensis]
MQEQILQAFQRNANDEAVVLAQQWVEQSPGQVQPLSWLATALRQQGQVEAALAALDQALGLQPDDAVLHLQRATLLLTGRQFEQAHAALERTTELDPNQLDSYLIQAHLALAQRDFERAQSLSKVAARLAPEHPQLLAIDGMVALHQGNADQALALLNHAAQQLPDDPRILYGLGFAFLAKDHLAFAEQTFRKVVAAQPDSLPLMSLVADLCLRQGNTEGAAQMLEQMLTAPQGNTPGVRRLAAMIQLQAGQPRAAADHAIACLQDEVLDPRALQVALMAWQQLGAEDEARQVLDAQLQTRSQEHSLWLARLAVEPVGSEAAAAVAQRWVEAMPAHVPAWEVRMRLHDMLAQPEQAEAVARRIIELEPGRVSAEQRVVGALLERNDADAAVAHVQAMIERADEAARPTLRTWLGVVQDGAQRPADAVATWLEVRQAEAPQRLPLPPQAKSPMSWPELAPISEDMHDRPLFVTGLPGSGVERVVTVMGAASPVLRTDRFGSNPPNDPFQRFDTLAALASGELSAEALVQQWRDALPARGVANGNIIDWLLWWDNGLLWSLRQHLPQARLLVVLRDPRDMLLEWLAFGSAAPFALNTITEATGWLQRGLEQLANLHDQSLYPVALMRIDGFERDPQGLAQLLQQVFNTGFPVVDQLPPPRLPSGHWRQYRDVLGAAFNNLTPVAVRLGYPEN